MFSLIREALQLWVLRARIEMLNQTFYAAAAYAHETIAKGEGGDFEEHAMDYVKIVLPKLDREEARKHLYAMQSRLNGVGAVPSLRL